MLKNGRFSNFELLRILCMFSIVLGHFIEQSGIYRCDTFFSAFFYSSADSLMRVACSVFIIISSYFIVEKEFKIRRVFHTWLALFFYTATITIILKVIKPELVSRFDIYRAFLPLETTPLWFLNYYIIFLCCTPILNAFLKYSSKQCLQWILLGFIIFSSIYTTLTARLDFFRNDMWTFFFLFLATGYIKKYSINFSKLYCLIVFLFFFLILTLLRTYTALGLVPNFIILYLEIYRAQLMTIPNILMAFSLFYFFKNTTIKNSKIINTIAGTTIGIYAFHQIPVFYPYLWKNVFQSSYYAENRLGKLEYLYVLGVAVSIFCIGCVLEILRNKISIILIEERPWFKKMCESIDFEINLDKNDETEKKHKKGKYIAIFIFSLYFIIFTIFLNIP